MLTHVSQCFLTLSSTADQQMIEDIMCAGSKCYNARLVTIECEAGVFLSNEGQRMNVGGAQQRLLHSEGNFMSGVCTHT